MACTLLLAQTRPCPPGSIWRSNAKRGVLLQANRSTRVTSPQARWLLELSAVAPNESWWPVIRHKLSPSGLEQVLSASKLMPRQRELMICAIRAHSGRQRSTLLSQLMYCQVVCQPHRLSFLRAHFLIVWLLPNQLLPIHVLPVRLCAILPQDSEAALMSAGYW